jgi:protein SCO1/2
LVGLAAIGIPALTLTGGTAFATWHAQDISGVLPPLALTMTDANTGKPVSAGDFRDKIVLLYFGYTLCPDFCPTTLGNLAAVLQKLGPHTDRVRVLFVTVDPNRDSLEALKRYVKLFAPQVVGLRGTPDQLAELARRYRVAYSVTPASNGQPYQVTHSSIVYVFDSAGDARLLVSSMATPKPDIDGVTADLKRLIALAHPPSLWQRVLNMT